MSRKERKIISYIITLSIIMIPIFLILLFPAFGIIGVLSGILIWQNWKKVSSFAVEIHKLIFKTEMR
jgi:hypothetical protein